jgi:LmbE family N-acetylglucosaminyl deacetylase
MITKKVLPALLMSIGLITTAQAASFYFVAHPDDIELFMARQAWSDVKVGAKVVFIVTTAGDGGRGDGTISTVSDARNYASSRQTGHEAALKYWFGLRGGSVGVTSNSNVTIGGKTLLRQAIGGFGSNVIMYNLRLADGYDNTQHTSPDCLAGAASCFYQVPASVATASNAGTLSRLRANAATQPNIPLYTIDESNPQSYTYAQLKNVLRGIISTEQDSADTWVNIQTFDGVYYDNDDHLATGHSVADALTDYANSSPTKCIKTIEYIGYQTQYFNVNYSSADQSTHWTTWQTLNDALVSAGGPDSRAAHYQWLYRIYTSTKPGGPITSYGPCN